jgi:scyllo-inositol 2-dehydrogenase (NAD+)
VNRVGSAPIGVAVLGLGRMGRLYARMLGGGLGEEGTARLVGIADPDPVVLAAVRDELRVPCALADPYAVLERAEVDAVLIATPTSTHAELVTAAAGLGKPILCEKPLALEVAETRTVVDAVERAGVLLQVGFMRRFDPPYVQAKSVIQAGQIGRPLSFRAIGRDPFCPPAAYADPASSGGLLVDMAIHDFDLTRWLMDSQVERVSAEGTLLACDDLRDVGDVDNAVVMLRFTNGALGSVEVSRNAVYGYDIRTEVLGSEGMVLVGADAFASAPGVGLVCRGRTQVNRSTYLEERFGQAYRAQVEHFLLCIKDERTPEVSGADALAASMIASAATEALRTGLPVTLTADSKERVVL